MNLLIETLQKRDKFSSALLEVLTVEYQEEYLRVL